MSNPDRTLLLDLSAIEEARGPQPNDYFVCLTRSEARSAALAIACLLRDDGCNEIDCPKCNRYCRLFWDLVNELGPEKQRALFVTLAVAGWPTPRVPWEEVK